MTIITGRIEGFVGNNIIVAGKQVFLAPDDLAQAQKNFKEGDAVKLTHIKGTGKSIEMLSSEPSPTEKKGVKSLGTSDNALKGAALDNAASKAGFTKASDLPKGTGVPPPKTPASETGTTKMHPAHIESPLSKKAEEEAIQKEQARKEQMQKDHDEMKRKAAINPPKTSETGTKGAIVMPQVAPKTNVAASPLADTIKDAQTTTPDAFVPQKANTSPAFNMTSTNEDKPLDLFDNNVQDVVHTLRVMLKKVEHAQAPKDMVPDIPQGYGKDAIILQQNAMNRAVEIVTEVYPKYSLGQYDLEEEVIACKDRLFADMWEKADFPMKKRQ